MFRLRFLLLFSIIINANSYVLASSEYDIVMKLITKEQYNKDAEERFVKWQHLVENAKNLHDSDKLELVNNFFNDKANITVIKELPNEPKKVITTPFKILASGSGIERDITFAKYYTLLDAGVPEEKLRISYVAGPASKVILLAYFENNLTESPLLLDCNTTEIKDSTQRKDLEPVALVSGIKLWLNIIHSSGDNIDINLTPKNPWIYLKNYLMQNPLQITK